MRCLQLEITGRSIVDDVVTIYPQTVQVLVESGFPEIQNPVLRRTLAKITTLEKACKMKGIDLETLLIRLREAAYGQELADALAKDARRKNEAKMAGMEGLLKDLDAGLTETASSAPSPRCVTGTEMIRDVIMAYPRTKPIFERHGMLECGGVYGPKEPVSFFARVHGVDVDALLAELNEVIEGGADDGGNIQPRS